MLHGEPFHKKKRHDALLRVAVPLALCSHRRILTVKSAAHGVYFHDQKAIITRRRLRVWRSRFWFGLA